MIKSTTELFVFLNLFFGMVLTASIPPEPAPIPVHIIYDDNDLIRYKHSADSANSANAIHNLDAKPQLTIQDLRLTDNHLPLKSQVQDETTFQALGEATSESNLPSQQQETHASDLATPSAGQAVETSTTPPEQSNPNLVLLIQVAQQIIYSGIDALKETLDRLAETTESRVPPISEEQWDRFNTSISNMFSTLYEAESSKAIENNPTVLQSIVIGFQNATTSFVQRFNRTSNDPSTSGVLTSGLTNIQDNLNNFVNKATTQTTILGDTPSTSSNPVVGGAQNVLNQVGQAISNLNPFQSPKPDVQSDENNNQPGNPIIQGAQNVLTQFGQAINNLNPFNPTTPPPGGQADSPTSSTGNPIVQGAQNVFNQVGQAINQLNPFAPPKPGGASDETTNGNPIIQGAQNVFNQVGQAINNLNLNPFVTPKPGAQGDDPTTRNPIIQGAQNLFNQVGQAINNLNPFPGNQPGGGNPIETIQGQVGPIVPPAGIAAING